MFLILILILLFIQFFEELRRCKSVNHQVFLFIEFSSFSFDNSILVEQNYFLDIEMEKFKSIELLNPDFVTTDCCAFIRQYPCCGPNVNLGVL